MDCVNLKTTFGQTYRVTYEESYWAERGEHGRADEPWLQIIPCGFGHIYPHGGNLLAVATNNRGQIARRISQLPFVTVVQDGSDGINATFPVKHFEEIAEIVKPRRRRHLSDQHRAKLMASSERHRFRIGTVLALAAGP